MEGILGWIVVGEKTRGSPHSSALSALDERRGVRSPRADPLPVPRRAASAARPRTSCVVRMGPPLPSRELGHVAGGESASVTVAAWLDYACPFSAKFYKTFTEQVLPHYGDAVKLVVYHQVQPWHPQSTLLHEAAIAVTMVGGEDALEILHRALRLPDGFLRRQRLRQEPHADLPRARRLARASADVSEADVMSKLDRVVEEGSLNTGNATTQTLKFHVKLGRQTGIHVSPTTTLNGMVCDTSSGWSVGPVEGVSRSAREERVQALRRDSRTSVE